jgi:hypothetical protein
MEVEKRKMIHLFKNTSFRTRNINGDLEYRRKKVCLILHALTLTYRERRIRSDQETAIPYQFQSELWPHQPQLCHRVLYEELTGEYE